MKRINIGELTTPIIGFKNVFGYKQSFSSVTLGQTTLRYNYYSTQFNVDTLPSFTPMLMFDINVVYFYIPRIK